MPQISEPHLQENQIIETFKEEGCAVSTQETAARREFEDGTLVSVPIIDSPTNSREENASLTLTSHHLEGDPEN
jgi:hypothetical protein